MTVVLLKKRGDTETGDTGRRWPCEDKGINWNNASTSQGKLRIADHH